ncbi:MAG: PAS domain-containing protein [Sphingobacterium sp.]|nr:PAS domain-containing protein [Sphingobacterium sp.]
MEWDTEFKVRQWNRAAERIFGYAAAEAVGRHALVHRPRELSRDQVDRSLEGPAWPTASGERSTNENVTKDGRTIACEWYNTPLLDGEGRVTGRGLAGPGHHRARAGRRPPSATARSSTGRLVAAIPDMIVRTDLDGNILFANDVAVRRSRSARVEDLVGRNIFSFVVAEEREKSRRRGRADVRQEDRRAGAGPGLPGRAVRPLRGGRVRPPRPGRRALRRRLPVPGHDRAQAAPRRASARAWSSCGRP